MENRPLYGSLYGSLRHGNDQPVRPDMIGQRQCLVTIEKRLKPKDVSRSVDIRQDDLSRTKRPSLCSRTVLLQGIEHFHLSDTTELSAEGRRFDEVFARCSGIVVVGEFMWMDGHESHHRLLDSNLFDVAP